MKSEEERRQDWQVMKQRKEENTLRSPESRQRLGEKASLGNKVSRMTGKPEWDWMIAHLEELHSKRKLELNGVIASFTRPAGMGTEHLRSLREQALRLESELDLLQYLIEMPEKIIRDGKKAFDHMRALEDAAS
jgi:hypothetical protein